VGGGSTNHLAIHHATPCLGLLRLLGYRSRRPESGQILWSICIAAPIPVCNVFRGIACRSLIRGRTITAMRQSACRTTRPCTRQGAEVWPPSFVGGQSLRRALQVKAGVLCTRLGLRWSSQRRESAGRGSHESAWHPNWLRPQPGVRVFEHDVRLQRHTRPWVLGRSSHLSGVSKKRQGLPASFLARQPGRA
jgi:hypothetical protein